MNLQLVMIVFVDAACNVDVEIAFLKQNLHLL